MRIVSKKVKRIIRLGNSDVVHVSSFWKEFLDFGREVDCSLCEDNQGYFLKVRKRVV